MPENSTLYEITWVLTPILVGAIGWFIVRNVSRVERDIVQNYQRIIENSTHIAQIQTDLRLLREEHNRQLARCYSRIEKARRVEDIDQNCNRREYDNKKRL